MGPYFWKENILIQAPLTNEYDEIPFNNSAASVAQMHANIYIQTDGIPKKKYFSY
jgi:hypothetical protein